MLLKTLGWLLGIFTIFLTGIYFDQGDTLSGIISILAVGFFIPPILNKINENAAKKAQEKQKSTKPTSLKSGVISGLVLLFFSYLATNTDSASPDVEVTKKTTDKLQESKPFIYIDEIQKLNRITGDLIKLYQPPYSNFKNFAVIKKSIEAKMEPVCNNLKVLVERTNNINSPYYSDFQDCRKVELSMMQVLFDIRDKDYQSIEEYKQALLVINNRWTSKIDEHINTPEFIRKIE